MGPVRTEAMQTLVEAMNTVMASADALLDLAGAAMAPAERDAVMSLARELVGIGSEMQRGLSEPQTLAAIFGRALEIGSRLASLAGQVADPGLRARLLAVAARLGESASVFDTGMRKAAEARGIKLPA